MLISFWDIWNQIHQTGIKLVFITLYFCGYLVNERCGKIFYMIQIVAYEICYKNLLISRFISGELTFEVDKQSERWTILVLCILLINDSCDISLLYFF